MIEQLKEFFGIGKKPEEIHPTINDSYTMSSGVAIDYEVRDPYERVISLKIQGLEEQPHQCYPWAYVVNKLVDEIEKLNIALDKLDSIGKEWQDMYDFINLYEIETLGKYLEFLKNKNK